MTPEEVLARARGQIGRGTKYELSRGGFYPQSLTAADSVGRCDCSGFVAWCLNACRQIDHPAYKAELGNWVETSAIVRDAKRSALGMFALVDTASAEPGMLYVWGDPKSGKGQGHVGIISAVGPDGPSKVIHCSKGNWNTTGDAIQETGPQVFVANHAIVARCIHVAHEATEAA